MAVVTSTELIQIARKNGWLLPAYNTTNMEMTLGILDGLQRAGMPGILQIAPTNVKLSDYGMIASIVKRAAEDYIVPTCLHLDHGKTLEDVRQAVQAGFTSVMIDGAALSFEENIRFSRQAVDYCHCYGVPVEAELGAIKGKEDDHVSEADLKTDPDQVCEFVERTGCDLLAVSIGNVHGLEDEPRIDLPLLEAREFPTRPSMRCSRTRCPRSISQATCARPTSQLLARRMRQTTMSTILPRC